jgi:homocysteine S-methyltransferase
MDPSKVDVLGANCSVGPQALSRSWTACTADTEFPLSVMPNAGLPGFVNGRFVLSLVTEYLADYAVRFAAAGARLVGGCCGTTPAHTRRDEDALRAAPQSFHGTDVQEPRQAHSGGHAGSRSRRRDGPVNRSAALPESSPTEVRGERRGRSASRRPAQEDDRRGAAPARRGSGFRSTSRTARWRASGCPVSRSHR